MEEEQTVEIQAMQAEWQKASDRTLEELHTSLQETQEALTASRAQLEEVQSSGEQRLRCLEKELHLVRAEHDHMTRASADLEAGHKRSLDKQQDRVSHLEELCRASTERELDLQQQVVRLQSECVTLKSASEKELHLLQSQLESMRVSQQELEEVREQLLARSRGREEEEQRIKRELESLRSCLEERHRGEVALLQLRLAEGGAWGSSAPQAESDSFLFEGHGEEGKVDMLAEINLKLEEHKEELDSLRLCLELRHTQELELLRSSLALSHREDLLQVKAELAETHLSQIQDLRSTHALELQRQRAQLYDSHAKEVSRLRLQCARDAARQVEQEVEERSRALAEELHARTAQIQSLEAQLAALLQEREEQLRQAREEQGELLRDARQKLKLEFAEQLHGELLKEREAVRKEVSQEKEADLGRVREELWGKEAELGRVREELQAKEAEFNRLREEIQTEAEGRISTLREELGQAAVEERNSLLQEVGALQQQLKEVQRRSEPCIKDSPDSERDPRIAAVRQKMEAQYQRELLTAKRLMSEEVKELNTVLQQQAEDRLQEAQRRFEKELQEQKAALCQQTNEHKEGLQSQGALLQLRAPSLEEDCKNLEEELMHKHEAELDSLRAELLEKHKAELDCLEAELRELSHAQLEAQEAELRAECKLEQDKMEARMLSNMDALEAALLVEVEGARAERDGALQALVEQERSQAARVDRLKTRHQAQLGLLCIELRRELDLVLMEAPSISNTHAQPPGIELQLTPGTSGRESQPEREVEEPDFVETGGQARELRDLFFKLKTDLRSVAAERKGLQEEHRQLQEVLKEVARRTLATEEEIQRRLCAHAEPVVSPGEEAREVPGAADQSDDSQAQRLLSYSLDPGAQGVVLESFTRLCSAISRLLEWVQEREELQRQAEEDQSRLTSRLRLMEAESEEQESCRREEEEQRKAQTEDLSLQIRALEKQLRHHRQFIEVQTVEREQEREDFQLEIRNLEAELRRSSKPRPPGGEDQVENLRAALRQKTEDYTELLQIKEKYKGDIAEQNEQIHKMAVRICKLEQDLLSKAELKRVQASEMMCPSCLLMYAAQCNPDEPPGEGDWPPRGEAGPSLIKQQADLQMELLTASMEPAEAEAVRSGPSADLEEALLWKSSNQNWECDRNVRKLPERPGETDMSPMLLDLLEQLEERKQEIQRLRDEILCLEREAEASKDKATEEAETTQREVEELRSQVEHLLSDRERLLKDREVQEERLYEVIHKLQEELEQMSPARHEVSPSLEGNPAPHSFLPLPLPLNHTPRGLRDSLCLELNFQTPHSEPQGVPDPAPSRGRRWGAGGGIQGGEERDLFQLMTEVTLDDGQLPGHAHSPGLRGAGEGREEAHQGLGRMGGQKFGNEPLEGVIQETSLRVMKTLLLQNQETNAQILSLEMENAELRIGKGQLQQEVEGLRQEVGSLRWEVTSKRSHVPCVNSVSGMTLDLREVLIFADETLAKTAVTLKENEERLALVKAELEALRVEHGALKAEHEALKVDHEALKAELDQIRAQFDALTAENDALKEVHEALLAGHASLKWKCVAAEERLRTSTLQPEEMTAERQTHLEITHLPSTSSPAQDTWHPPDSCSTTPTSTWRELSTPDSPPSEQVQRLDERYFTGQEESDSDGGTSGVSLDQESPFQEVITSAPGLSDSFLQYLHHRNMDVEDQSDSTTERMGEGAEVLSPELQVWLEKVHGEGQRVLYLSEHPATMATPRPLQAPPLGWQEERQALQQTVLSLRDLLCRMAAKRTQGLYSHCLPLSPSAAIPSIMITAIHLFIGHFLHIK
ncbi:hypothetical protein GJAV_G00212070 [Gymnothorax javanicus]|nr:hypothetical protein GJAV_G00212070 [Gymnothorax javanicus]